MSAPSVRKKKFSGEAIRDATKSLQVFLLGSPAFATIGVFAVLVMLATSALMLPAASVDGTPTPLADALFTAVSAICVSGLTVVNMATHWSPLGHAIIFASLQIGGIGVMTLATILALVASRKLGLSAKRILASDIDPSRLHEKGQVDAHGLRLNDVKGIIATVVLSTLVIELVLATVIVPRLWLSGLDLLTSLWQGVYLAGSVFTNTGFVPLESGLGVFEADATMVLTVTVGGFLGSLGFPVILAFWRAILTSRARHRRQTLQHARLGLHAKLTLVTSAILLVIGTLAIGSLEWSNDSTIGEQSIPVKIMNALFVSTMARSAGFNVIPIEEMHESTLLIVDMLMFVGGGSASTAGGIKVTTLAVLFLSAVAESRGDQDIAVYERRIPSSVVRLSVTVVLWGATIVAVATILLLKITEAPLSQVLFEAISAFATCGLSAGISEASLAPEAKYVLSVTMLLGRVGTVTLATAISGTHRQTVYRRAAERPIVG
jgi:Trk-type K+ transport system membrane component